MGKKKRQAEKREKFRIERVKSCPLAGAKCVIVFPDALIDDLNECVAHIRNEFIVFLRGAREHARIARVQDAHVPKQRVSAATAVSAEGFDPSEFIAVAHSHHVMGAFHSPTDEEGVDNAPISIVMSTRRWCAKFAHRLPCGRWGVSDAVLIVKESESRDAIARASRDPEIPPALSSAQMGDCPDARAGMARVGCGISVRQNILLREILAKSEPEARVPDWALLPNFYLIRRGDD